MQVPTTSRSTSTGACCEVDHTYLIGFIHESSPVINDLVSGSDWTIRWWEEMGKGKEKEWGG